MTTQKSSQSRNSRAFSPFFFTFSHAFSENFIFPLLNTLWITLFIGVMPAFLAFSPSGNPDLAQAIESGKSARDLYRFFILPEAGIFSYFMVLGVGLFAGLLGVFLFRFMAAKKTVNVYYALGIRRKSLFLAKYAAGAVMLAASTLLPVLISAAVNLANLGSVPELWKALAYYGLSLYLVAMICMTVTAAVFSAVGTVSEGIGFSVIILFLPTIFIYCLQSLMSQLVWGSAYNSSHYSQYLTGDGIYHAVTDSLVAELTPYNPLFFMQKGLSQLSQQAAGGTADSLQWPSYWALLIWAAVIVVFLVLALVVFQRRKAEISGFIGKNRLVNACVTFIPGFGMFTFTLGVLYSRIPHAAAVAAGLAAYLIVYLIMELILVRSWKEIAKGLWKLPIHLVIPLAVFAVFSSGLFGYVTRVPDTQAVKEVYLDADYDLSVYDAPYYASGIYSTGAYSAITESNLLAGGLTSDRDKEMAVQIHQAMIDAKDESDPSAMTNRSFAIVYVMEDGSTIKRYYSHTALAALEKTLALYESDWSRERLTQILAEEPTLKMMEQEAQRSHLGNRTFHHYEYGYETGTVSLAGQNGAAQLELTKEQHAALKQALTADLNKQTAAQAFYPETPQQYTLLFASLDSTPEFPDSYYGAGSGRFPLTADMDNTLAFLRENGLLDSIPNEAPAVKQVYAARVSNVFRQFSQIGISGLFLSNSNSLSASHSSVYEPGSYELALTATQFEAIRPNLYTRYYAGSRTGYGIAVEYEGYSIVYYLPERCATEFIKSSVPE